jgi:carboxylesterase
MIHPELLGMRYGRVITTVDLEKTRYLQGVNIKNAINPDSKRKAIMLIHGFSSTPTVFRHLIPYLSGYDKIIAPVLPGHASSIAEFADIKACDWLTEMTRIYLDLMSSHEYAEVHLLGLSLGGLLAQQLAQITAPKKLILLAPAFDLIFPINGLIKLAEAFKAIGVQTIKNRAGNIKARDQYEIAYKRLPVNTILEILNFIKIQQISPIDCSTNLFLGKFDSIVASKKVERRYKNFPNTQVFWLNNSAHVLPLDNDREFLGQFLANLAKN